MPCRAEILALSALLMQALPAVARPATAEVPGIPAWTEGSNGVGNVGNYPEDHDYDYGLAYDFTHSPQQAAGDGPHGHCGGGHGHGGNGGHGGGGDGGTGGNGGYPSEYPTVTVSDCTSTGPTSTVTITIGDNGSGAATITEMLSACTATSTITGDDGDNAGTITVTDTLVSSITACTATTTDLSTLTVNGPTTIEIVTTNGPTVTSIITTGATTVTDPFFTETTTVTETSTEIDATTITSMQVITSIETITQTETLEFTTTVTSDTCSGTGGGGGNTINYGTCSDPYILYEYGLDGRTEYAYTTRNQADFPFGSSPTIGSVADLICNRLRSPCNAPQATIDLCYEAEDAVANLSGQEAADVWNAMMT